MHFSHAVVVAALAASASALNVRAGEYGPPYGGYSALSSSKPSETAPTTGVGATGTASGYPMPTGKGPYQPSGSFPKPPSTGESPIGSGVGPTGTGVLMPPSGTGNPLPEQPIGSGSGIVGPTGTGTGSSGSPITSPARIQTTTVYGPGTTTITSTSVGTTTLVSTITTFVPCSTPIATAGKSTYYSTFLTVSYSTATVTATTTKVQVICPSTQAGSLPTGAPVSGPSTTGSSSPVNGNTSNSGSNSYNNGNNGDNGNNGNSLSSNSPVNGNAANSQSYKPTTVFGSASAPTSGTCAPAQTVYSTMVVTVAAGGSSPGAPCSACQTYTMTLPNGSPYTAIVTPTSAAGPQSTTTSGSGSPPYPYPGQEGSGPQGSGSSYIMPNGPTAAPSASGAYGYGGKMYL